VRCGAFAGRWPRDKLISTSGTFAQHVRCVSSYVVTVVTNLAEFCRHHQNVTLSQFAGILGMVQYLRECINIRELEMYLGMCIIWGNRLSIGEH
jgi:hypothetical protein